MPAQPSSAYPFPSQRVVVFRHGERRDNHPDAPAESNPPLTEEGVAAVRGSAARLKHYLGAEEARAAVLVVSPFLRTVQTAEALQLHGVGADGPMVIDNTLCEVFGPSRIKTGRAPQLQDPATSRAVGGLPMWGESLELATQRYVVNFLRNGDVYAGLAARGATPDTSLSVREESQTSSSLLCPAAVTKRTNGGGVAVAAAAAAVAAANASASANVSLTSPNSALVNSGKGVQQRDVILVTHGDAISAVLSHFYPARVVYEADFLSFIIMRRYGVGNHVYHLDESAGVNWFVEGIDSEPQDLILRALEMEREAAAAQQTRDARAANMRNSNAGGVEARDSDKDVDDDDEGEALDEDVAEDTQPASFAGSRMKARTSRLPPRRIQSRAVANIVAEASTSQRALPPTQVHLPPQANPRPLTPRVRRGTSTSVGSSGSNGDGVGTPTAHTGHAGGAHASRHHPKAGEGCERIRLPDGTPAQSSSSSVLTTMEDAANHHRGHSTATSSGGEADTQTENKNLEKYAEDRGFLSEGGRGAEPRTTPLPSGDGESSVQQRWSDAKPLDMSARLMSSYGGLTADTSSASWVRSQVNSVVFSRVAVRDSAVCPVHVVPEPPVQPSVTVAARPPLTHSASSSERHVSSPTLAARISSRASSAYVSPMTQSISVDYGMARTMYEAAPPLHLTTRPLHVAENSFSDSTTSAHPCNPIAPPTAPSETGDDVGRTAEARLARRIDRHKALSKATVVSYFARTVCLVLAIVAAITVHAGAALGWYGVLAVAWEVGWAILLTLSCRVSSQRVLRVRRAVEQLKITPVSALSATRSPGMQDATDDSAAGPHEDETGETPLHRYRDSATNGRHYESSMVWQNGTHAVADEDAAAAAADAPVIGVQRRTPLQLGGLCVRHVAATAVKLCALFVLSFFGALIVGVRAGRAVVSVGRLYTTPAGLIVTLLYGCVNVARGIWDETRVDAAIDRYQK